MKYLEDLLEKEISVAMNLHSCQKRMYHAVTVRDWVLFQKEMMLCERISAAFNDLEKMRHAVMDELHSGFNHETDFYRVSALFPEESKIRINALYRELKRILIISKAENKAFTEYVSHARQMVSGILDSLLPVRKNKIYTRSGAIISHDPASLVVNRSF